MKKILKFIVSNRSAILKITLVTAIVVFILMFLNLKKENKRLKEDVEMWTHNYLSVIDSFEYYKDKSGEYVTKYKNVTMELKDFTGKKYNQDIVIAKIKKELKNSKIENKQLQEALYSVLTAQGEGFVDKDTVYIDSTGEDHEHIFFNDGYLMFDAYKGINDYDYGYGTYFYSDTLLSLFTFNKTPYNKEGKKRFFLWRWLFPRYKIEGISKSSNPNSLIEMAIKYKIKNNRLERKLLYEE